MYDDVMTRNESGELAVRTVSATEGSNTSSYDDVFTRTTDGKLAMRVVGSGGSGDQHNLGYFATPAALQEAYPTAEAGDWAIVGATDTVWIWDTDNSEWVDSDQKGQVTSVNGQTGAVTVSEVPSQTGYSGRVLGTDGFVAGWVVPEKVQRSTMPQASEEEVNNIYQYVGTTDANYTNGYFYKCVSDGQDPATYSWEEVSLGGASYTAGVGIDITNNEISLADTGGITDEPYMLTATEDSETGEVTTSWSNEYVKSINGLYGDMSLDAESIDAVPQSSDFTAGTDFDPRHKQNEVVQYSGATDQDYTEGYFYKSVIDPSEPASATLGTVTEVGISNVSFDADIFLTYVGYEESADIVFEWRDSDGGWYCDQEGGNVGRYLIFYGITYGGTPTDGDSITVEYTAQGWKWQQIDVQPSGGVKVNTTATLAVADWSSNTQTVNVTGMTANGVVLVSPTPANQSAYTSAGILCTAQAAGSLTFTCDTVPSADITVTVVML